MGTEKVTVITGASGGIGAALALRLAGEAHRLVLAARRERELQQVAAQCGNGAVTVVCDVRHRDQVNHLRDRALETFGRVDVWVNNAGRGIGRRVLELSDEDVDEMMAVNLKSALYGMQAIMPHFMERGDGHLINVSSFLARVPLASFRSAYNAAKAALNALTSNLRMDLQPKYPAIHVTTVMPGVVMTDFRANALGGTPVTFPGTGTMRPQTAEQVAEAIAEVIRHPVPEIYTNPALADVARRYAEDVAAFEAGMHA